MFLLEILVQIICQWHILLECICKDLNVKYKTIKYLSNIKLNR